MRRTRVLVVEDNLAEQRVFSRALAAAGHDVSVAASAVEARQILDSDDFDLILSDLALEREDSGLCLLQHVKKNPSKRHIPFVTLTGKVQLMEELKRTRELGAADCLTKPITMADLRAKIAQVLAENPRPATPSESREPSRTGGEGTVLVVDDDDEYRSLIEMEFSRAGFKTYTAALGLDAIGLAKRFKPTAIILDFGLPDMTGLDVVKNLKTDAVTSGTVILVLTGNNAKGQEVTCLEDGADQYLVKGSCPVDAVVAHMKAMLRMKSPPLARELKVGPVALDIEQCTVTVDGKPTNKLTTKEFELLALLVARSPNLVGWEDLGHRITDLPSTPDKKAQDTARVHLCHIKKKLGPAGTACLQTYKHLGLKFLPPATAPKTASDGGPSGLNDN